MPWVDLRHAAYCAAWQDAQRSEPAKSAGDGAAAIAESRGGGSGLPDALEIALGRRRANHAVAASAATTTPTAAVIAGRRDLVGGWVGAGDGDFARFFLLMLRPPVDSPGSAPVG